MTTRTRLLVDTGSGTFVKPQYLNTIIVEAWGGGGAGSDNPSVPSNGGAAGGQYAKSTLTYQSESISISYIVASSVGPNAGGSIPRRNGSASIWDNNLVVAQGGSGSLDTAAGLGSTVGGVGDIVYRGGNGRAGNAVGFIDPHGGGGAGSTGNGNDATSTGPGAAKSQYGGAGGIGGSNTGTQTGNRAGGGGVGRSGATRPAGSGGSGLIRLTYDLVSLPTYSNTRTVLLTTQGAGVFKKPAGVRKILVEGWGAGGRGNATFTTSSIFNPPVQGVMGSGGAGGNYARTLTYYQGSAVDISYIVCTQTGSGNLSASMWFNPNTNNALMVATRGADAPPLVCSGSSCYSNGIEYSLAGSPFATGSTVGCVGDVIYKGGNASSQKGVTTYGGYGGGGAGSSDSGMDSYVTLLGTTFDNTRGVATDDFGGAGTGNLIEDPNGPVGYAGGGGAIWVGYTPSGSLGGPGLLRLTLFEGPLVSKIEWNGNTLLMGYELDNAVAYSTVIDGSQFVRIENGDEYSWIPNTNYILEGDVRWIPTTSTATQTGWDGATGWRAFLEYARAKNKFRFYIDSTEATYIDSYLVEPLNGQHDLEIDGTRRIRLVIRNTTTPYTGF